MNQELTNKSASEIRQMIRNKEFNGQTSGLAPLNAQANLAILPKEDAFEFLLFCQRNPKSCPILDVTEVGNPSPALSAKAADLRTDIPKYHVYQKGEFIQAVDEITDLWRDDFVAFLMGAPFHSKACYWRMISKFAISPITIMFPCLRQISTPFLLVNFLVHLSSPCVQCLPRTPSALSK